MCQEASIPSPNVMTFSAAISACSEENSWPWALHMLEEMQMQGFSGESLSSDLMDLEVVFFCRGASMNARKSVCVC